MSLRTSVIIPTKDRPHDLDLCVDSIMQQDLLANEVIVIDDGNLGSEFIHGLKTKIETKGIAFLYSKKTVCGICKSRNLGARLASNDILFFVDDDSILDKQYISNIVKVYQDDIDGRIGGIQGAIYEKSKDTNSLKEHVWCFLEMFFCIRSRKLGEILPSGFGSSPFTELSEITKVKLFSGCCSYRKEVFGKYSYDEDYEHPKGNAYREDSDFSYRVSREYDLLFLPTAKFVNSASASSRLESKEFNRLRIINYHYFFGKNISNKTIINYISFVWAIFGLLFIRVLFFIGNPHKGRFEEIKGIIHGYFDLFKNVNKKKLIKV